MNETLDKLEIVDKKKLENLDLTNNVSIISELCNNKYLIKYSGKIDESIKDLYSNKILLSNLNKKIKNGKEKLKDLEINKTKTILSAVHISAAISSYARILINDYKNIPGNPCIMSDTDSAVLIKPLPDHLVGKELDQIKLVHNLKQGIFIRKNLYCLVDSNDQLIIKSSGIDSNQLNHNSFKQLLNGESIKIKLIKFNVEWKDLSVNVIESKIVVQGLKNKIKTIYNTPDANFKSITLVPQSLDSS